MTLQHGAQFLGQPLQQLYSTPVFISALQEEQNSTHMTLNTPLLVNIRNCLFCILSSCMQYKLFVFQVHTVDLVT